MKTNSAILREENPTTTLVSLFLLLSAFFLYFVYNKDLLAIAILIPAYVIITGMAATELNRRWRNAQSR
jgi:hypothetical protein